MSFDRVAPFYRRLETLVFGGQLQAARCAFVREVSGSRRALLVGEGDGRFLEQLLRAQPELRGGMSRCERHDAGPGTAACRRRSGAALSRRTCAKRAFPPATLRSRRDAFFSRLFRGPELSRVVEKLSAAATDRGRLVDRGFSGTAARLASRLGPASRRHDVSFLPDRGRPRNPAAGRLHTASPEGRLCPNE